ncbi:pyridoxal phosphate-dependent aminotransferase [Campylobacter sp. faydin G-24]|uniref:cysteine-S-conjugate beta-lyase n=1 Tax=Campylobacter anatolicus TaxID=2829105 RepID=A0ABS5HJH0_9BACT|nr:MalY/PatB family protein [Campylobacter anatolicus]MBR8464191.1 pyridoxal phosphate-dependent aminotransferase [Campylobacter anatolicus]
MYNFDEIVDRAGTFSSKWNTQKDELPMWVADMDFKAAPEILDTLKERLDKGTFGYSHIPDEWAEAISIWWQTRHNVKFKTEWAVFCTGVIPAISSAIRKFSKVGDKILVQSPVYHVFYRAITNNDRQIVQNELLYDGDAYSIDFDNLEQKLSDPLTKMMILCNPHNPIGKIWSKDELKRIGELCLKHNVLVVSDEIHCDITDPCRHYTPFAGICDEFAQNSLTCISPTKAFNIAGLQSSAIIAPNDTLRCQIQQAVYADDVGEPNSFAIVAAVTAFTKGSAWLDEMNAYVSENKRIVDKFIKDESLPVHLVRCEATYLLWLDCSAFCDDATQFTKFLREKTGLWLNDGNIYRSDRAFVRMNIATQRSRLLEGLKRLKNGINLYKLAK